jgi:hypothetical protein
MRLVIVAGLAGILSASNVLAEEDSMLGWTRDGAFFVYKTADDTGVEQEYGMSGSAQLAIVVDGKSGQLTSYLLELGDATAEEKKRYHALPNRAAYEAWLAAHPVRCVGGRKSPDGKTRADVKVKGKLFSVSWSEGTATIDPKEQENDPYVYEVFKAELTLKRDGKVWAGGDFEGRMAFYGGAQGGEVVLCWSPDGTSVAWNLRTPKTMRDPEINDISLALADGRISSPESERTAEMKKTMLARRANVAGMKAYRAKNYAQATTKFREAIAANAAFVTAHYNLACVAALQADKKTAIAELKWLSASSDPEAKAKLKKAATDPDLRSLAGDPEAKPFFAQ